MNINAAVKRAANGSNNLHKKKTAMGYLGIESKEVHDVLMNEIG